jgi:hypothetical protein
MRGSARDAIRRCPPALLLVTVARIDRKKDPMVDCHSLSSRIGGVITAVLIHERPLRRFLRARPHTRYKKVKEPSPECAHQCASLPFFTACLERARRECGGGGRPQLAQRDPLPHESAPVAHSQRRCDLGYRNLLIEVELDQPPPSPALAGLRRSDVLLQDSPVGVHRAYIDGCIQVVQSRLTGGKWGVTGHVRVFSVASE